MISESTVTPTMVIESTPVPEPTEGFLDLESMFESDAIAEKIRKQLGKDDVTEDELNEVYELDLSDYEVDNFGNYIN